MTAVSGLLPQGLLIYVVLQYGNSSKDEKIERKKKYEVNQRDCWTDH